MIDLDHLQRDLTLCDGGSQPQGGGERERSNISVLDIDSINIYHLIDLNYTAVYVHNKL